MILQTFFVAFFVSFIGSIPPGTINVSVMQLAMLKRKRAAIFLAFAASTVEFLYAGVTVLFHSFLTDNETISFYFKLITSATLLILGMWNLFKTGKSINVNVESEKGRNGFMKGLLLGILNPMTIPFWLAITTYLENDCFIEIKNQGFWMYLLGLSLGTFCLLMTVIKLGYRFTKVSDNTFIVRRIPGIILLGIGAYFLIGLVL